jgi:hypothetical protein
MPHLQSGMLLAVGMEAPMCFQRISSRCLWLFSLERMKLAGDAMAPVCRAVLMHAKVLRCESCSASVPLCFSRANMCDNVRKACLREL